MTSQQRLLLFGLIAFNLVVKLLWLGVNELAHDEPFTVYWSQQPLATLWEMLRTENNPPLYFLLIKAWSAIVPFQANWLRVPSALFSALAVWPLFLLARRVGGIRAALVTSLLFSVNNYHYGYAHEVRAYSLFTLLAATGMWLLWRAKDKPNNGMRAMVGLAALNVLLVYTHFFGWLAIGVQGLCVLVLPELRHLRRNFLFGLAITLAWFSPYLVIFLQRMGTSVAHGTWLEAPVPEELYNMIWRWSNAPVLAIGFLALIVAGVVRSQIKDAGLRLALLWAFVPLLGMFAVSFFVPMFLDRYLVYAAPGFALLVALCVQHLRIPDLAQAGIAALAVVGMGFTFTPWKEGMYHPSRVVAQVDAWRTKAVLIHPSWYEPTYLWAHEDQECFLVAPNKRDECMGKGFVWSTNGGSDIPIDPDDEGQVVLVDAIGGGADQSRDLRSILREHLPKVDSTEADHRVWVYRFRR